MSEKEIFCKNCRFFNVMEERCQRRSPAHRNALEFAIPAYLQAMALSALRLAKLDVTDFDEDLRLETTELYKPDIWPVVKGNDWCGEFSEAAE